MPCLVFQRLGAEGEEEDVGGEIVFSTIGADSALSARGTAARAQGAAGAAGAAGAVVRGHVAEDIMLNEGVSARTRVAVVQPVRVPTALSEEELVHVTPNAVQLIAGGRGTPGVLARVAASRNKPER